MKKLKQLVICACFLLTLMLFTSRVKAYEQDMLLDCISSARENTSIEGVSDSSIENYCDCALELIVDERKDVRDSGYECAVKNFQN